MNSLKDMVIGEKKVTFQFYSKGELWYQTECGFDFPVPIEDCGDGIFMNEDRAMLFMRYIRKHIEYIDNARRDQIAEMELRGKTVIEEEAWSDEQE